MESLLTPHVENQHSVTNFKRETFILYEYAIIFGSSVEEAVKWVSKWAVAYYTHPNSYYKLPTSNAVSSPRTKIAKPTSQEISRNEQAEMRAWAKMRGKSVRQQHVRQDNTMDMAGTLPLNLCETETVLKPVNLNSLKGMERVPNENVEPRNQMMMSVTVYDDVSDVPGQRTGGEDSFSASDSDSEEEVDATLETALSMIRPTRLERLKTLTSRMPDFLQAGSW